MTSKKNQIKLKVYPNQRLIRTPSLDENGLRTDNSRESLQYLCYPNYLNYPFSIRYKEVHSILTVLQRF